MTPTLRRGPQDTRPLTGHDTVANIRQRRTFIGPPHQNQVQIVVQNYPPVARGASAGQRLVCDSLEEARNRASEIHVVYYLNTWTMWILPLEWNCRPGSGVEASVRAALKHGWF